MKMLVVMSIAEYDKSLKQIFAECKVSAFSEVDVEGYKNDGNEDLGANWFAASRTSVYSKMAVLFLDDEKAKAVMEKIKSAAEQHSTNPFHAVLLNVEQTI
ncbi:MAG: hypothetical protein ACUVRP_11020 [Chlorobiales bacterium]